MRKLPLIKALAGCCIALTVPAIAATPSAAATATDELTVEVFVDADKGIGTGAISTARPDDNAIEVSLEGVETGAHLISFRTCDGEGRWSGTVTRALYVTDESLDFEAAEYFIDSDPGAGKGSHVVGSGKTLMFTVATGNLKVGAHTLTVRLRSGGAWISTLTKAFAVKPNGLTLEWFLDSDPGVGKANPLEAVTGSNIIFLPTDNIAAGAHIIGMRAKDLNDRWSSTIVSPLLVIDNSFDIVKAEFYVDTDPGEGRATTVAVAANGESSFTVATANLAKTTHNLVLRGQDQAGHWHTLLARPFEVTSLGGIDNIEWKMGFEARREGDMLTLESHSIDCGSIVEVYTLAGVTVGRTRWDDTDRSLTIEIGHPAECVIIAITSPAGIRSVRKIR